MDVSLSDEEFEDRFFVLSRMEILSVLNELIHRREPVTVSFGGGRLSFLTTLLEVRPQALIFDMGGDVEANDKLPASETCVFAARPEGVRVQFSAGRARRFSWGGSDAFWVPVPERIVRLQRRESFRVALPVLGGPVLKVFADGDGKPREWPIHDLSVGGLGASVGADCGIEVGSQLARISFSLHGKEQIRSAATVAHLSFIAERHGNAIHRLGVRFDGLSRPVEVQIQRTIIEIEHERRERLGGGIHDL
jgi:c-di-GMP-binding flagellar brake protein YcgR